MIRRIANKIKARRALKAEKRLHKALKKEAKTLANKTDTAYDKAVISWEAQDYVKLQKGVIWYTIFAVIILGGAGLAYFYISWTFSLALIVFGLTYLVFDRQHPKRVKVTLSEMGIKAGNKIYQYNRIQAFWIAYNPPFVKSLIIRVYNEYLIDIEIQLGNQDPGEVHNFLSTKLPELEGKEEGFFAHFTRLLKL